MERRIWKTKKAGKIKNLKVVTETMPILDENKVRVAIKAVGLNFADIFALVGLYSATPKGSFIPGLEFAGDIIEVGTKVTHFKVGDPVFGVTRFGGYATVIDSLPIYCRNLPDGWNYAEGAAYPAQTLTAWYALKMLADAKAQQCVLIQSAAGGVGLQALKICKSLDINYIGTVSTNAKKDYLHQEGFSQIIVRDNDNFEKQVKEILGDNELHIVLDAIGGKLQKQCYKLLSPMGRLIIFGAAEYTPSQNRPNYFKIAVKFLTRPLYDSLQLISDNKSVMGFNLIWLWNKIEMLNPMFAEMESLNLRPHVGKSFPFCQALEAIEHLRKGTSIGKIVLLVDEIV